MSALFVSDLHIDVGTHKILDGFRHLIERETPGADALYILGDLVEVWVGDDDDSELAAAIRQALALAAAHCPVFVMHGNRDFLFGEQLAKDTGVELISDPHVAEIDGENVLLAHGDAYCTKDRAYQQVRALFRSPSWQQDVLGKSLEERRELARSLRVQSAAANANKADNIMDVTTSEIVASMQAHGCARMVHGHTHRPGVHEVDLDGARGRRYVLGDWGRCGWLLRMGETAQLECFAL